MSGGRGDIRRAAREIFFGVAEILFARGGSISPGAQPFPPYVTAVFVIRVK